ncbi:pitrilysin family protein [Caenimonas sp. SL110]|uniref:M16 family metallopeptidase n=1 Tax=Caenimonas sp. SL110 TaxID=1450524 RepID=UPI00128D5049|nr:pitrilysin family protein [Caenimonas sp. SL110]
MRTFLFFIALLASLTSLPASALPANVEHVETFRGVAQYRLKSNGMTILVLPQRAAPVFTFMVVYHVGSRNESPGNTGSAHLLEHMIFNKSTQNFGRANGHKTFQEVIYEAGGDAASSNMTTWYDRMTGYSTFPSDKLELAMRIEAERMSRALILDEERKSEMSVVRNEFEIGENQPSRVLAKSVIASAIQAHPYHWSTIGYRSDIEGVTTEKLREHYKTFFHPDNSSAILIGDFDTEAALTAFDRQFGAIARAPHPIPPVITVEPPQEGERRASVRRPGTVGLVHVAYMRPAASHPDFMALEVLGVILGDGVNSRLYRSLVDEGLATSVDVSNWALRDPFAFYITASNAPGRPHRDVEAAIKSVVAGVADKGVTEVELARAKRQIEIAHVRSREGSNNLARNMAEAVASTDWKWFLTYTDRIAAVSAEDVKRVAATYLVTDRATVGWFEPTPASTAPGTPAAGIAAPPRTSAPGASIAEAAASSGSEQRLPFAQRTSRKVLANGLIVDVVVNRALPTVSVRGLVTAGGITNPPTQAALSDLVGKMLSRGTTLRTKEQIGALLNDAGATRRYLPQLAELGIEANGMARDLPMMLGVLAEELRQPAFTAAELARAKRELENDYLRADDDTSFRAQERLAQLSFSAGHPYHAPGREARARSLAALTQADLQAFHKARFGGASMILAIVGDVDANATIALVEKLFGSLARGDRPSFASVARTTPAAQPAREAVTLRGKANMNIIMGMPSGLRRTDADFEAALVGNAVMGQNALSSRIGKRVRDTEGLSYSIYSRFLQSDELDGVWLVNANVAPQNVAKAIRSTREVIELYAREGASDAEVAVQKSYFEGNFKIALGTNSGIASNLVAAEKFGFGPAYLDEFPKRIAAVTTAQANEAMRKHFSPARLHLVVAGDLDKLPD